MKMLDMTCPKCGATMQVDAEKEQAVCQYCGALFLLEQEDTLEEIQAKAEAKAYGYHKGKLAAEERAAAHKKKNRIKIHIPVIVITAIVLLGVISYMSQEVAKPLVNPFDCIAVSFQGTDGDGEIVIEITNAVEGIDVNRIEYDISKEYDLLQGENVSIEASSNEYRLAETTKVYIVEGLDEYLKDLEELPKEALEMIHMQAEEVLELNLDGTKAVGYFVDMKPVKLFLATDGKQTNELYDVFEVRFATGDGEEIYYVLACFDNVIVRNGEQTFLNMSYGVYYGNLTQVQGASFIMAYDSLEEIRNNILLGMESYMELKERDS